MCFICLTFSFYAGRCIFQVDNALIKLQLSVKGKRVYSKLTLKTGCTVPFKKTIIYLNRI